MDDEVQLDISDKSQYICKGDIVEV